MTAYHIMLAGNPNVGKSTLFNALTGLKQHTGNWSGKTVELASGSFVKDGCRFNLTDLPGTYSIISNSPEEEIARDAICFQGADYTLVVADATCLARNLNLLLQIQEITPNVALCVNLMDEAKRCGIFLDLDALSRQLRVPVIGIAAHNPKDIRRLKTFLCDLAKSGFSACPQSLTYPASIETAIAILDAQMQNFPPAPFPKRLLALRALDNPSLTAKLLDFYALSNGQRIAFLNGAAQVKSALMEQGISSIELHDVLVETVVNRSHEIAAACSYQAASVAPKPSKRELLLTSRRCGIPVMLAFLAFLLWITISAANYPSQWLLALFGQIKPYLSVFLEMLHLPPSVTALCIDGIYHTTAWVVGVMLPPMMIFFPLFTLLEDWGFLPRLAFNLDRCFQKAGSCGKMALTMCMGLGCNAVGVTGCRILSSKKERFAAMITNCFIPCNGRFSMLITLSTIFIGAIFSSGMQTIASAAFVLLLICIGAGMTLIVTYLLTHLFFPKEDCGFVLELPPFRKPQIAKTLVRAFLDRTLKILWRAVRVSVPAGAIIWLLANFQIQGVSLLTRCADFLDPFAGLLGLDGMILLAFLLSLPANEIVLPIILMGYLASGQMTDVASLSVLQEILAANGWTVLTAVNVMLFSLLHFPCATTLWTIQKESGQISWTLLGFVIPTLTATVVCMATNGIFTLMQILF